MNVIYKHVIPVDDRKHEVEMGFGDEIVHVEATVTTVSFWFTRNIGMEFRAVPRTFRVIGTGQAYPDGFYRGTAISRGPLGGTLVWHLIEVSS